MAKKLHEVIYKLDAENSELKRKLKDTRGQIDKVGKSGTKAFKLKLTGAITAAAVAVTGLLVKFGHFINKSSELEESSSKLQVIFKDVRSEALKMRDTLVNAYDMSEIQATKLLSASGDMLTGFGMNGAAALDLASRTNILAADIASFSNVQGGAERASRILTKMLLGQRDGLTELGISILESDVKQRLFEKGQKDLTGTSLKSARAVASLELAYEQSGNAIGDLARTSDSYANTQRRVTAGLDDMYTALGKKFMPSATSALNIFNKLVDATTDFIKVPVTEEIRKEQAALNALVGAISLAGDKQKARNDLIIKLQEEYPDFLENINTEKVTTKELRDRLEEVNKEYREKIKLKAQEEITNEATKETLKLEKEQLRLMEEVAGGYQDYYGEMIESTTDFEKVLIDLTQAQTSNMATSLYLKGIETGAGKNVSGLIKAIKNLIENEDNLGSAYELQASRLERLNALRKKYNVDSEETDETDKIKNAAKVQVESIDSVINKLDELQEEYADIDDVMARAMADNINNLNNRLKAEYNTREKIKAIRAEEFEEMKNHIQSMSALASQISESFVSGLAETGALKDALKQVLITLIGFLEKYFLAAKVAALIKASMFDFTAFAQIAAISLAFQGLKATVASFAVGVENFGGGLAYVHKDEMMNLPKGTNVYSKTETKHTLNQANTETNRLLRQLIQLTQSQKLVTKLKGQDIYISLEREKKHYMGH